MSLEKNIERLAAQFAAQVVSALRGASLADIAKVTGHSLKPAVGSARKGVAPRARGGSPGRLPRRSQGEIDRALEAIVAVLRGAPKGLRAEQIQAKLRMDKRELPRPIQEGIVKKRLVKKGEKRATTYFLGPKAGKK